MSLFKARDWWATVLGEGEEFDQGCLCVGDVDNSGTGHDKLVVGSYMGMLRVFSPQGAKGAEPSADSAHAQLLEVQLRDPVVQVELGKFVSCSELLHLAVLHPRKLSVYAVSGSAGNVTHGNQYQLKLVYEHNLQRTACNMTHGTFGGITGHHQVCIQSMDGMLMVFEQESYSFGRFLPGFLLPGPLVYCPRTDTFLTCSSARTLESYRYETLAVATDAETRQDPDQPSKTAGKRLTADWSVVLGEQALDLCVSSSSSSSSSIFVLGERSLFCLRDNGQIRFMKKLEYNPSCFLPYGSVTEGSTNTLVGNHSNMLLVYQDTTLRWAAQLSCAPVAVRLANLPDLKGGVVTLSAQGQLQVSYMGTDPSFFSPPKVDSREADYAALDQEMRSLTKTIREASRTQDILSKSDTEEDLTVWATVSTKVDSPSQASVGEIDGFTVPSVTIKIQVKSRCALQASKLAVCVPPPLALTHPHFTLGPLGVGSVTVVTTSVFLDGRYPPADLTGDVALNYTSRTERNPTGVPRVAQCCFSLPLSLVCQAASPSKNAKYKITVETNKPPINLNELFPDFRGKFEDKEGSVLAFWFISGARVSILASKTSQRYRIQSDSFQDMWLVVKELVQRLESHFARKGVKDFKNSFSGPVPLAEYFESVDHHFELRVCAEKYRQLLAERAVQFRAIQRRMLTRFKDKTPAPLQNLDTLMEGTYRQVMSLAEAAEEARAELDQAHSRLRAATHLLVLLVTLWQNLPPPQVLILQAALLPLLADTPQLGWEECVDAAVCHLLRTCLSRGPTEAALPLAYPALCAPPDTSRLKKHVTLLCDRLAKGGRLSLASDTSSQPPLPLSLPGGVEPIVESELEDPPSGDLASKFLKKKLPSKKVKKDKDVKDKKEAPKKEVKTEVKKVVKKKEPAAGEA